MVLVTAATPWEARPLIRAWGLSAGKSRSLYEGSCGSRKLLLLETGIGRSARPALDVLDQANGPLGLVISSGFVGALQPGVDSGELVMDLRGAPAETLETARKTADALKIALHLGRIVSSERVLTEPEEKKALGEKERALAVDMESSIVRDWASSRGIASLSARVVLDSLEDRLPEGLPKSDSPADLARYALGRLGDWTLLLGLAFKQRRSIRNLTGFLDRFIRGLS